MVFSRRVLLVSGAALAAVAALGVREAVLDEPGAGFRSLSADEALMVTVLGETMFPASSPIGVGATEVGFAEEVDTILADVIEPDQVRGFRYLLRAIELSSVPSHGARFSTLPAEARRVVLAGWEDPAVLPRRMGYEVVKVLVGMAYFSSPAVRGAIGWRAGCGGGQA